MFLSPSLNGRLGTRNVTGSGGDSLGGARPRCASGTMVVLPRHRQRCPIQHECRGGRRDERRRPRRDRIRSSSPQRRASRYHKNTSTASGRDSSRSWPLRSSLRSYRRHNTTPSRGRPTNLTWPNLCRRGNSRRSDARCDQDRRPPLLAPVGSASEHPRHRRDTEWSAQVRVVGGHPSLCSF